MSQEIDYIQLEKVLICIDKTEEVSHIVYGDHFDRELLDSGFSIEKTSLYLPIDKESCNELAFSHYELDSCELYLFDNLAIKANENGMQTYCKEFVNDTVRFWKVEVELEDLV